LPFLNFLPKIELQLLKIDKVVGKLTSAPMPVISLPRFVVVAKNVHAIVDQREPVLIGMPAAR
jgi:hypothetical protein